MQKNKSSTCLPVTARQANDDKAGKAFETQIKGRTNVFKIQFKLTGTEHISQH